MPFPVLQQAFNHSSGSTHEKWKKLYRFLFSNYIFNFWKFSATLTSDQVKIMKSNQKVFLFCLAGSQHIFFMTFAHWHATGLNWECGCVKHNWMLIQMLLNSLMQVIAAEKNISFKARPSKPGTPGNVLWLPAYAKVSPALFLPLLLAQWNTLNILSLAIQSPDTMLAIPCVSWPIYPSAYIYISWQDQRHCLQKDCIIDSE